MRHLKKWPLSPTENRSGTKVIDLMLTSYIICARPYKHSDVTSLRIYVEGHWIGFPDFKVDFWISEWISGFHWISGFQIGFLPTVYEISFVADSSCGSSPNKKNSTYPLILKSISCKRLCLYGVGGLHPVLNPDFLLQLLFLVLYRKFFLQS